VGVRWGGEKGGGGGTKKHGTRNSGGGTMKLDIYTKVILTIIAIALTLNFIQPIIFPPPATANSGTIEVDIVRVGGWLIGREVPTK